MPSMAQIGGEENDCNEYPSGNDGLDDLLPISAMCHHDCSALYVDEAECQTSYNRRMRILLTNDDGIHAPGLAALYRSIADLGEVHVVAPATVQSAMSHAVTFHRELEATPTTVLDDNGEAVFEGMAVDGSPADCVKLGVNYLVEPPVDLLVSGMNRGANVGVNVLYSGTVAAAAEGAILGVPAIAVSLLIADPREVDFDLAAGWARPAMDALVAMGIDPGIVMNVNVPATDGRKPPRGVAVAPVCPSPLVDEYEALPTDAGATRYRVQSSLRFRETSPESDVAALFEGRLTVSPLRFDVNLPDELGALRRRFASMSFDAPR